MKETGLAMRLLQLLVAVLAMLCAADLLWMLIKAALALFGALLAAALSVASVAAWVWLDQGPAGDRRDAPGSPD